LLKNEGKQKNISAGSWSFLKPTFNALTQQPMPFYNIDKQILKTEKDIRLG